MISAKRANERMTAISAKKTLQCGIVVLMKKRTRFNNYNNQTARFQILDFGFTRFQILKFNSVRKLS